MSISAAFKLVRSSQSRGELAVFLDDDYPTFLGLREAGKSNGWEWTTCKNYFHETYAAVEDELLKVFAYLAERNDNKLYWQSQIASRNAASNALPRLITYLVCAADMLKRESRPLVFVVSEPGLAVVLSHSLLGQSDFLTATWYRTWRLRQSLIHALRLVRFIARAIRSVSSVPRANLEELKRSPHPICLLRSWNPDANATTYSDRSFGDLHVFLKQAGFRPIYTPLLANPKRSVAKVRQEMKSTNAEFMFAEQVIGLADIARVAWHGIRELRLRFGGATINGWDVSILFAYVHLKAALAEDLLILNLGAQLLRRCKSKGIQIARIIYTFENNSPEKSFLLEARTHQPQAMVIGFQHSPWYKEHPSMKLGSLERSHPLPDRIIASGSAYRGALIASGFPGDRIQLGANLRLVVEHRGTDAVLDAPKFDLLVVLNYSIAQAVELFSYIAAACKLLPQAGIKIAIKAHPLVDRHALASLLHGIDLLNWEFTSEPVITACRQARAVLAAGSTIANLEVLLAGRPLLQHSLENEFDRDCIWHNDEQVWRTRDVADLAAAMQQAFQLRSDVNCSARIDFLISSYFLPKTPGNVQAFID